MKTKLLKRIRREYSITKTEKYSVFYGMNQTRYRVEKFTWYEIPAFDYWSFETKEIAVQFILDHIRNRFYKHSKHYKGIEEKVWHVNK